MYTILNPALLDDSQINIKSNITSHKKTIKSKGNEKQEEKNKIKKISDLSSIHKNTDDNEDEYHNIKNKKLEEQDILNKKEFDEYIKKHENNLIPKKSIDVNELYDKSLSNYNDSYRGIMSNNNVNNSNVNNNTILLNKLNYLINLVEEQKVEKTNYVTEELILYLFLGIFIIFILDSFVKITKYTR